MSKVPAALRDKLLATIASLSILAGGGAYFLVEEGHEVDPFTHIVQPHVSESVDKLSPAVLLAMDIGAHYESSGRHIGTPYVDAVGKGRPLTVCNGITGKGVIAGKYYTVDDCKRLEAPRYIQAEMQASSHLRLWSTYNALVRASFIDMYFNLGPRNLELSTMVDRANSGDLQGACMQQLRWVSGTVNGKLTRLNGLVNRRNTTSELCAEWGRYGHFSVNAK